MSETDQVHHDDDNDDDDDDDDNGVDDDDDDDYDDDNYDDDDDDDDDDNGFDSDELTSVNSHSQPAAPAFAAGKAAPAASTTCTPGSNIQIFIFLDIQILEYWDI